MSDEELVKALTVCDSLLNELIEIHELFDAAPDDSITRFDGQDRTDNLKKSRACVEGALYGVEEQADV